MERRLAVALPLVLAVAFAPGCDGGQDVPAAAGARAGPAEPAGPAAPPVADAPPAGDRDRVPQRYVGHYAADAAACDRPGDPSQLEVAADALAFHESHGAVVRAAEGPEGLAVTAAMAGEGAAWEATYRFALSADGGVLTDLDGGMERVRCG